MRFAKHRPTPAMVVAILALMVALGGTSYAAIKLPKNSVGTKQIKKRAVTGAKIRKNAVESSKVKDSSLMKKDFAPGQLPAGPQGPAAEGPRGPAAEGPRGPAGKDGLAGTNGTNGGDKRDLPLGHRYR